MSYWRLCEVKVTWKWRKNYKKMTSYWQQDYVMTSRQINIDPLDIYTKQPLWRCTLYSKEWMIYLWCG